MSTERWAKVDGSSTEMCGDSVARIERGLEGEAEEENEEEEEELVSLRRELLRLRVVSEDMSKVVLRGLRGSWAFRR